MANEPNFAGLVPPNDPAVQAANQPNFSGLNPVNPNEFREAQNEEKYGSVGQQVITGLEGGAEGVIGAAAPALEEATGLTTGENIRGRAATNPLIHGAANIGTFAGSALVPGLGEYTLGKAALNVGEHAAALLPAAIPKIAQTGVRVGAEMAALGANDELSKMVTHDPDQTLGSAALNIGLSGVMGFGGGAALGAVSPLWNKALNITGVEKVASDFMGETKAIQEAGDPLQNATKEISGRMDEADAMRDTMRNMKPDVLAKAMPEVTPENMAKIDAQINDLSGHIESTLNDAAKSIKTKSAVPYLAEDFQKFQSVVTDPNATFASKFLATDELKRDFQGYAKWAATEEGTAKGILGRDLSGKIRTALEDAKVWGAAGDVQRITNEATHNVINATKDFKPQLLSNTMNELGVAPEKVQTLLNQTNLGKAGRKASTLKNYLEYTQKQADAISHVFLENGIEAPASAKLNPTPFIDHALNTPITPGVALARWANKNGAAALGKAVGETGASAVGGGLGALVGHPLVGAWMGEKVLTPIFSALAKPLAENSINSAAAKSAVNYLGDAIKGQRLLNDSTRNFFRQGADVLAKDLIPDQESRDKLHASLDHFKSGANALNVGGSIGHYLPDHGTAAAQTAATASNYLESLKPKIHQGNPLDAMAPMDKAQLARYNRALDLAQQPLLLLKHAKNGTLLPEDLKTVQTIYPGLYKGIVNKLTAQMIEHKNAGHNIPYAQRLALNSIIGGTPLDGTMTPGSYRAIMSSSMPHGQAQPMTSRGHISSGHAPSAAALSQITKVDKMFATPLQARQARQMK